MSEPGRKFTMDDAWELVAATVAHQRPRWQRNHDEALAKWQRVFARSHDAASDPRVATPEDIDPLGR